MYLRRDIFEQTLLCIVQLFLRNQEKKIATILVRRFETLCFGAGT